MSAAGTTTTTPTLSTLLSGAATQAQAGIAAGIATAVKDLTLAIPVVAETQAEDLGTFIDNMAMDVETGMTWSAAFKKEFAVLEAAEKAQLYGAAMTILSDAVAIFDSWVAPFKAFL